MHGLVAMLALGTWTYGGSPSGPASPSPWSYGSLASDPKPDTSGIQLELEVASLRLALAKSEVATLRRQLAERDAAPEPPDIGPAYSCRFADGRTAQGWIIRGPSGDRFVEDKDR